ncbi:hypothetical protein N0V91_007049 [Didymella pomorum]|uniref:Uncharacterized protein n=1 Tax=Didymella pomorum TaxID=749634 RepID=A0A9W8ZDL7_9PLEO|nr:hypothetical protein N0V91_007049 [Didymella pomorum]
MGLKFWRLWIDEEKKELEEMVRRKTGNEILAEWRQVRDNCEFMDNRNNLLQDLCSG